MLHSTYRVFINDVMYPGRAQHCGEEVDDEGGEEDESVWTLVLLHQILEGVGFIYN
jgi:hypothetical protein